MTVALLSIPPLCGGGSNGKITAVPSGSVPPYTYLWSNGSTANPLNNIPAGFYSVTVTSSTGMTATASVDLPEPPVLQGTISVTDCTLPGSMTVNASGGVPPYSYLWNSGQTTQSIGNLNPAQYCVTVTDNNGCAIVRCQNIGSNLVVQVGANPVVCGSSTGGSASAIVNGGVTPYTYLWSNGAATQNISNLPPGTYTVTVTAANGCSAFASGEVILTSGNFGVGLATNHPTCQGSSTGSITANPNGGASPFTYVWNNGGTSQTINNLQAGSFTVTVTDHFGCTATQLAVLNYQSNLNVNLNPINPTCSGTNNGSVSASPNNGVPPYNYLWNTGATTQTISNAGPGTYTVTVTDNLGCTATKSSSLVSPPPFLVTTTAVNATNCGASNGSVSAMPGGGGSPPFLYLWSNGGTSNSITDVMADTYTVTVTSSQGCVATAAAIVSEPDTLQVTISGTALVCGNDNNGSLTANFTYGTAPHSFSWSNGGSTQTVNNLAPGTYTVTVTSSQGCTGTDSHTIGGSPGIGLDISVVNVKCHGTATGKITVTASGGTPPIQFSWSNGATSNVVQNLTAGQYTMTVTDAAGCSRIQTITITQPAALNIGFTTSGGSCGNNGFATANVAGGTMPFQFLWATGQTSQSIFGIPAGEYHVTVTDANQCSAASSTNIFTYPAVELEVSATNTTCNGTTDGTVTAVAMAGTPPYSFFWGNGATTPSQSGLSPGNYKVTVSDDHGCTARDSVQILLGDGLLVSIDAPVYACPGQQVSATANAMGGIQPYSYLWSNAQTTQTALGLVAGSYIVTVLDSMGCSGVAPVDILPGGGYSVNFSFEDVSCNSGSDGTAALIVSGGMPPYNYLWSTGDTLANLDSLTSGSYFVTIIDATGCTNTQTIPVAEPPLLIVNAMGFDGGCGGMGAANVQAGGGVPPYTYLWNTGSMDANISNLTTGVYAVTVTDTNFCTQVDTAAIVLKLLPLCEVALLLPVSEPGLSDAQLTVEVEGGTPPFNFNWNNGQTDQTAVDLGAALHVVTITDANQCQATCDFSVYNPGKIGDFVWEDSDLDGLQDNGENGLANVKIDVAGFNNYGQDVATSFTTGMDGLYSFTVQPGKYRLMFSMPNGFAPSPHKAGNDGSIDSDINHFTGWTDTVIIGSGEVNISIDAGFYAAAPCENVTGPGTICCDQQFCGPGQSSVEITGLAVPTGGAGDLEFQWFISNTPGPFNPVNYQFVPNANGASFASSPVYQTSYLVRGTRREGCVAFLFTDVVTLKVDSLAVAAIEGPDTTCIGLPVDFNCFDNGPGASYSWTFQEGEPLMANTKEVAGIKWNTFDAKTVTLTVENQGCVSIDEKVIVFSNNPVYCGDALIIFAEAVGPKDVLVDWYYPGTDSVLREFTVEWAWESDDFIPLGAPDSIVPENSFLHYFLEHHEAKRGRNFYRVKLVDSNGALLYSNIVEVIMTGGYSLVHAYPNPFSDYLDIEVIDRYDAKIKLEIINVEGRKMGVYLAPETENYLQIDTRNLAPGNYYLLVKYNNKPQKIFKMVKWGG